MRPLLLALAVVVLAPRVWAQDEAAAGDTLRAADGWRTSLTASLAGNQATHVNWQEGGVDALAVTASAEGTFDRVVRGVLVAQSARLAFGVLRQDTLEFRKAADVARYDVSAELVSDNAVRPAAAFSARTQFAAGFDYDPAPEDYPSLPVVPGQQVQVSGPLAPLTLGQSVGVAYRPGGGFRARTGLALKETVVRVERLRPVYGNALDQPVRVEAGVDAEAVFEGPLVENVRLRSRLSAFQGFGQLGETAPDALFENSLVLKVNSLLNVTLDATALYDGDVSEDLQFRESLAVGVTFDLL
jgi:hypothetical protein